MNNIPQDMGQMAKLLGNSGAVKQLLQSEDTKRMMQLLQGQGSVQSAAQAAAKGDSTQLMGMMQQLMRSPEGAQLVERITKKVQENGL
ncbi:MAG: hypothetical protein E7450_03990 [Ruminococcaceae bacterium]|nr:hypothetical protein [Oscillospiraceae bacterium]